MDVRGFNPLHEPGVCVGSVADVCDSRILGGTSRLSDLRAALLMGSLVDLVSVRRSVDGRQKLELRYKVDLFPFREKKVLAWGSKDSSKYG